MKLEVCFALRIVSFETDEKRRKESFGCVDLHLRITCKMISSLEPLPTVCLDLINGALGIGRKRERERKTGRCSSGNSTEAKRFHLFRIIMHFICYHQHFIYCRPLFTTQTHTQQWTDRRPGSMHKARLDLDSLDVIRSHCLRLMALWVIEWRVNQGTETLTW